MRDVMAEALIRPPGCLLFKFRRSHVRLPGRSTRNTDHASSLSRMVRRAASLSRMVRRAASLSRIGAPLSMHDKLAARRTMHDKPQQPVCVTL